MAVDSELRWMIQQAGGTVSAGPALTAGTNLAAQNGYPHTTTPTSAVISGTADKTVTASVKVNGVAATYTAASGAWTLTNTNNTVGLKPGINAVQVRAYNAANAEISRRVVDVWYDDTTTTGVSGTLAASSTITWTPANGPYLVTATTTVPATSTLVIQPGTSVYFAAGTRLIVNGTLTANGTDFQHIRFTRNPSISSSWGGVTLAGAGKVNGISYADFAFAGSGNSEVLVTGTTANLDHVTWASPASGERVVDITGTSSISMTRSVIAPMTSQEPVHFVGTIAQQAIFQRNVFGTTTGKWDIIDFTGGNRPGQIVQFLDNWFTGSGPNNTAADDILDIDGTDAHVEGNVFMNVLGSGTTDTNSAIACGGDSGNTSEIVSTRNLFYNMDHAFLLKEGDSVTSINDTFVKMQTAVFNFDEPGFAASPGAGGLATGAILVDVPVGADGRAAVVQNPPTGAFAITRSIMPGTTVWAGAGNLLGDPKLANAAAVTDPTADFAVLAGSPAIGTGPNGVNMGALVPAGVSIAGEPAALSNQKNVTLTLGFGMGSGATAAGYVSYQYRVNGGAWSAETPIGTPISLPNLADGSYQVSAIGKNDAGVWQATDAATLSKAFTIDATPPKVSAAAFDYAAPTNRVTFTLSEAAAAAVTKSSVVVRDLTQNVDLAQGAYTFGYDAATRTGTVNFTAGRLADGDYRLTVKASGVSDPAANALDGNGDGTGGDDYSMTFFQLAGDVNRDRTVDFNDLVVLAQNYNTSGGKAWKDGDFTGDGAVDFNDLVLLAQAYNTGLGAAPVAGEAISFDQAWAMAWSAPAIPATGGGTAVASGPGNASDVVGRADGRKLVTAPPAAVAKPRPVAAPTFGARRVR